MKIKILAFVILLSPSLFGQANVFFGKKDITFPQKPGFYQTEQDFLNDSVKYVGEFEEDRRERSKKPHLNVIDYTSTVNFGKDYFAYRDAKFFGYKDDCGNRYRIINGTSYVVRAAGAIWIYTPRYMNQIDPWDKKKTKIIKAGPYSDISVFYSKGNSTDLAKIKKWDKDASKEANEKLFADDPGISQQYMSDKQKDYFPDYNYLNALERIIFYVDSYNKKHK